MNHSDDCPWITGDGGNFCECGHNDAMDAQQKQFELLQEENRSLREALEFYANKEHWKKEVSDLNEHDVWGIYYICDQFGLSEHPSETASKALKISSGEK